MLRTAATAAMLIVATLILGQPAGAASAALPPDAHAYDLVAVGRYLYVAEGQAGLAIYDTVASPSPALVGTCDTPGTARDVSVRGSYAYVADGDQGIKVIDVSNPAAPTIVAGLSTAGSANHVSFSLGRLLQDFESTSGWVRDDGTLGIDAAHVKHGTGSLMLRAEAGALAAAHRDNLNWDLSSLKDGLQLWVYLHSPGAIPPGRTSRYLSLRLSNSNADIDYFQLNSNNNIHEGWNLLRIAPSEWQAHGSPSWTKPIQRMRISVTGGADYDVSVSIDDLRGGVSGLGPAFVWTFDDGNDSVYSRAFPYLSGLGMKGTTYVVGNKVGLGGRINNAHLRTLYDAGWAIGNHTIDHTDLRAVDEATATAKVREGYEWLLAHAYPRAARYFAYPRNRFSDSAVAALQKAGVICARRGGARAQELPVDERYLLNSYTDAGVTEPWLSRIDRAIETGSTIIYLGHDYDGTSIQTLQAIADYLAAKGVWCPTIDEWWRTSVAQSGAMDAYAGQVLYVSDGTAGMLAVDVSDPLHPTQVGQIDTAGSALDVASSDQYAVVAQESAGVAVVNAATPSSLAGVGSVDTPGTANGVVTKGSQAFVADGAAGLQIVNMSNAAHPTIAATCDTPGDARDVAVLGNFAYVADGAAGLSIIDIKDPALPTLVETKALTGEAEGVIAFGDKVYVAVGDSSLQVVPAVWSLSLSINGGQPITKSRNVQLTIGASRVGHTVTDMRLSANGSDWNAWEDYATPRAYTLSAGDGRKIVYVQFRDEAGALSPAISQTINLDALPPVTSDNAPVGWTSKTVTVTLTARDAGTAVTETRYSLDGGPQQVGTTLTIEALADHSTDGVHGITYSSTDQAGNVEATRSCAVRIDTRKPTTRAPYAASVRRGLKAALRYKVVDLRPNGGSAKVVIRVRTTRGRLVKTLRVGVRPVNKLLTYRFRCTLPKRTYKFSVYATDRAGNVQVLPVGSNRLVVR